MSDTHELYRIGILMLDYDPWPEKTEVIIHVAPYTWIMLHYGGKLE